MARNVALVDPAGMVTEPGSVTLDELDVKVTVAPPVALTVTVHVLDAPAIKVAGAHEIVLTVTAGVVALTLPPVAAIGIAMPLGEAPNPLISPMAALLVPERVTVTVAAIPFGIVVAFMPDAMQVYEPEPPAQVTVLPAEDKTGPAETLRLEMVTG